MLVKDGEFNRHNWPVGIIVKVFPGDDGLVRAVVVRIDGKVYSRPVAKLVLLMKIRFLVRQTGVCSGLRRGPPGRREGEKERERE